MTDSEPETPPAQKVTDEELLTAVEYVLRMLDAPAVPTAQVAADLPIARQTVKRRLDDLADEGRVASLATGQGQIWWLPDGEGGHVDPSVLNHPVESIDPYDIPTDLAREIAEERLPEFQPPTTRWERLYQWGTGQADNVVALVAVALVLFILPSPGIFRDQLASIGFGIGITEVVGLLTLTIGLLLALVAGGARILGILGEKAVAEGYLEEKQV